MPTLARRGHVVRPRFTQILATRPGEDVARVTEDSCRTPGRAPNVPPRNGSRSARRAACWASIPTPCDDGPTRAASPPSRRSAAIGDSNGAPWSGSSPHDAPAPSAPWAASGDTTDRLNAAYRRRYGELASEGTDLRSIVPEAQREAFRQTGRRLADALVRYLDGAGQSRADAEAEAVALAAQLGAHVRRYRIPIEAGVGMFVAARRPFLAELRLVARRSGVSAVAIGQLYDASTGLLDRLLLVFVDAHATSPARRRRASAPEASVVSAPAAGPDLDPRGAVRGDAARPVARPAPRVPARLGVRDAVLRDRRRRRGASPRPMAGTRACTGRGTSPAPSGRPAGSGSGRRSCSAGRASATRTRSCSCSAR